MCVRLGGKICVRLGEPNVCPTWRKINESGETNVCPAWRKYVCVSELASNLCVDSANITCVRLDKQSEEEQNKNEN